MNYQLNFKTESDYLIAKVYGIRTQKMEAKNALTAIQEIAHFCEKNSFNKAIIVWEIEGAISPDQALILISNLKKYDWSKRYITASVHPNKTNFDSHQYTAKVADTLGWSIRFFNHINKAKEWINRIQLEEQSIKI